MRYDDIDKTLVPERDGGNTLKGDKTLVNRGSNSLAENLGTMVINSDTEDESTMKSRFILELQIIYFITINGCSYFKIIKFDLFISLKINGLNIKTLFFIVNIFLPVTEWLPVSNNSN